MISNFQITVFAVAVIICYFGLAALIAKLFWGWKKEIKVIYGREEK